MTDRELDRIFWGEGGLDAYAEAEKEHCRCEALCTCGWNRPDSPVMIRLERAYGWRTEPIHD